MIPSDGVSTLFKEAALKRIEQILLAEWREKKDFYQREGQKREKLIEKWMMRRNRYSKNM